MAIETQELCLPYDVALGNIQRYTHNICNHISPICGHPTFDFGNIVSAMAACCIVYLDAYANKSNLSTVGLR